MVTKKGKKLYVPPVLIDEIEDIKREESLVGNSEAMRKVVEHARVGREVERIVKLDFKGAIPRIPMNLYPSRRPKKKRGGLF